MPIGKACAQVAHASVQAVLSTDRKKVEEWEKEGMKKVVLEVADLDELMLYQKKAAAHRLKTALIKDAAKTFFDKPTVTCLAIGPDSEEKIDAVTGDLKIL